MTFGQKLKEIRKSFGLSRGTCRYDACVKTSNNKVGK